jgi:Fur family ferric uptake transcriptional regulator
MREFLRTKGFKMTPQRELIFRSFFELGQHVSVDELYAKVRTKDRTVGYATVWRNLKLICKVGLAEEVNIGDGTTRYDRVTKSPHGHLYCTMCKQFTEFDARAQVDALTSIAREYRFSPDLFKIEVLGVCDDCSKQTSSRDNKQSN